MPLYPIEVADQTGARLRLRPPFAVDGRRIHGLLAHGIEPASDHCQKDRRRYETGEERPRHIAAEGNRRAADRPSAKCLSGKDKGMSNGASRRSGHLKMRERPAFAATAGGVILRPRPGCDPGPRQAGARVSTFTAKSSGCRWLAPVLQPKELIS
jgi:hypothetical protein